MSARVIPDLKPNEDYKLECEEIFKIIQQWALCGLDFVFSWNWYSYRPWEGEDTALCTLNRAFLYIHLLLVYRVTCIKFCQHMGWSLHFRGNFIRYPQIKWSSVFSWPGDAEDTGRPGLSRCRVLTFIGSILAINQAGISWRPQPPELTPDTEPITGNTGPHYYRIILLFVFSLSGIYCPCNNRNTLMLFIIM